MKHKPRQWILDKIGAVCVNQRQSWHATSPTHHIFFGWDHFFSNKTGELKVMDLAWDKTKFGYQPMLDAVRECMSGEKMAGVILQIIEDGAGEEFNKTAEVKYTKTSFYLEVDLRFDEEKGHYIGKRTNLVRVK